ncbi:MAG: tRNA (adenosine(37)-N6)-threonylcarbamoyltransferase complex transferase subunit TsaD [Clostridiales bacterium]|nr:tRNA (adenosine(37)-N6)-threonylcarbamoyltransferase complex transferase subunit TsaD [Clostridiales bacterium]
MTYSALADEKLRQIQETGRARVLAIETSCDETAAAVVEGGRTVLSNVIYSQIPLHRRYGGVVPELASRNHVGQVGAVVRQALAEADTKKDELDAIAVTSGPGLVGALLVGVSFAKAFALGGGLPLLGCNHILGHIAANYLSHPDLEPPFTCLIVSGGHTHLIEVEDYARFRLLGRTRDDAAGEALDKVARALCLPYPGGPELEKLALSGDPHAITFHSAFNEGKGFDMSFSGIKTALINRLYTMEQRGETVNRADLAAGFQYTVNHTLTRKAIRAAITAGSGSLALAGGVSANQNLRGMLSAACAKEGIAFYCPQPVYCTDNAAMIGAAAYYQLMAGERSELSLNAYPNLSIFDEDQT